MPLMIPAGLRCSASSFNLSAQSVSGGPSLTGFEQVIANPFARWRASLTFQVVGEEEILAYNAFLASCQGRANTVLVPPRDGIRPRGNDGRMLAAKGRTNWSGNVAWFDGAPWAGPAAGGAIILGNYAVGATSMILNSLNGRGPRPGNYLGISGSAQRLYRVLSAEQDTNGVSIDITFQPPLREPAAANSGAILDRPLCTMRLDKDDSGYLDIQWRQPSTPKLDFVEVL